MSSCLNVTFVSPKPIELPLHELHYSWQGLIYRNLTDGDFIHDEGLAREEKKYKPFTFCLEGKKHFNNEEKSIVFNGEIILRVASVMKEFLSDLANNFILKDSVTLLGQELKATKVDLENMHIKNNKILVKAASPITTYTTFYRRNKKKFTHYFQPHDLAFQHFVEEGLINKYEAYYKTKLSDDTRFLIKPEKIRTSDKVVTWYKNIVITAWKGLYWLEAPPDLLEFALSVGVGSKCSQGFGFLKFLKEMPKEEG